MSKFPELMNEIATLKNECITATKQVSENDEKIHASIDKTVDNLESSLDVCFYPNREVQIPLSKIYTEVKNRPIYFIDETEKDVENDE